MIVQLYFVGSSFRDLFYIARSILVQFLFMRFVSVHVVHPLLLLTQPLNSIRQM